MSIAISRPLGRAALYCLVCVVVTALVGCTTKGAAIASTRSSSAAAARTQAKRHLLVAEKTAQTEARGVYRQAPTTVATPSGKPVLAYPPAKTTTRPLTVVYLHGMHGRAENGCPFMRSGASELGWLVCPRGVEKHQDGTASWGANPLAQAPVVLDAIKAAERSGAASEPGVAIGFSQGSYVALDLVKTKQVRFRGLVLLAGPEAHPSAARLREAGVVRVALGAGARDDAYGSLVADAARLTREGIEARFFDLGNVGHTYDAEDRATLRAAIAWAGGIEG